MTEQQITIDSEQRVPREQQIPIDVEKRLKGWRRTFWAFLIAHYVFGVGGVLASTIAATGDLSTSKVAGIVAAVFVAILGFVQPEQQYRKYVVAWRLLDEKVSLYRHGLLPLKELIEGMAMAEKALDQIERETKTKP